MQEDIKSMIKTDNSLQFYLTFQVFPFWTTCRPEKTSYLISETSAITVFPNWNFFSQTRPIFISLHFDWFLKACNHHEI